MAIFEPKIQRRQELTEAAVRGIREYLDSTRGAHACGSHATIGLLNDAIVVTCDDGTRFISKFVED